MERLDKRAFEPLDQEEKELMESIKRDEWQQVENFDQEKKKAMSAARNTLKKDKRRGEEAHLEHRHGHLHLPARHRRHPRHRQP